jgi:hypothetical protein
MSRLSFKCPQDLLQDETRWVAEWCEVVSMPVIETAFFVLIILATGFV